MLRFRIIPDDAVAGSGEQTGIRVSGSRREEKDGAREGAKQGQNEREGGARGSEREREREGERVRVEREGDCSQAPANDPHLHALSETTPRLVAPRRGPPARGWGGVGAGVGRAGRIARACGAGGGLSTTRRASLRARRSARPQGRSALAVRPLAAAQSPRRDARGEGGE